MADHPLSPRDPGRWFWLLIGLLAWFIVALLGVLVVMAVGAP